VKENELLKLITVVFLVEELQLQCVSIWTLFEFHCVGNFYASFEDERFMDSHKVYEAV